MRMLLLVRVARSLSATGGLPAKPAFVKPVLEKWFGPCYEDGFSEESVDAVMPLHWGIRRTEEGVKPIAAAEQSAIDEDLRASFGSLLEEVRSDSARFEREVFEESHGLFERPRAALALLVLCDQVSRNVHRKQAEAFSLDGLTARWSERLLDARDDLNLHPLEVVFALLPLEHSEDPKHHKTCLFELTLLEARASKFPEHVQACVAQAKQVATEHAAVVTKFGRYPHRNDVLGRESTPDELAFLNDPSTPRWGQ